MSDTILAVAIRAGCATISSGECDYPDCDCGGIGATGAILRAALPWDLPAERLQAMAETYLKGEAIYQDDLFDAQERYRADPIMRELWPEKFK